MQISKLVLEKLRNLITLAGSAHNQSYHIQNVQFRIENIIEEAWKKMHFSRPEAKHDEALAENDIGKKDIIHVRNDSKNQ